MAGAHRRCDARRCNRATSVLAGAVAVLLLCEFPLAWLVAPRAERSSSHRSATATQSSSGSRLSLCGHAPPLRRPRRGAGAWLLSRRVAADIVPSGVETNVKGSEGTADYRLFFTADGQNVSPWHDVPLYVDGEDGMVWMVTEIPKMTKPKMECATDEPSNPIKQDSKKGKLRDYHGPIFWNYGFLPRTWEDPGKTEDVEGVGSVAGDNDPVDVVEIGTRAHAQGEIVKVKVLGSLAMIDEGELDWKVIAIAADDPLAKEIDDSKSLAEKCPEVISGIREWFRWYKTPDGKPVNSFGFDEETVGTTETLEVIEETHKQYKDLLTRKGSDDLWLPEGDR